MSTAVFYHAGCPVCVSAEQQVLEALDHDRYDIEVVHLGETPERISNAESVGVEVRPRTFIGRQRFSHQFRRFSFGRKGN